MDQKLLSIQEAAKRLKVSTKTLRRWEARGVLVPQRTTGAHRRYTKEQTDNFWADLTQKKQGKALGDKKNITPFNITEALAADSRLRAEIKLPTRRMLLVTGSTILSSIFLIVILTFVAQRFVFSPEAKTLGGSGVLGGVNQQSSGGQVLAAATGGSRYSLNVNVPSNFLKDVEIKGLETALGGIETQGADVNADTGSVFGANLIYGVASGSGILIGIGQTPSITNTGVLTLNGSTGELTAKGSGSVSVSTSGKTITISSSAITSEADTLATVTGRGATTSTASTFSGGLTIGTNLSFSDTSAIANLANGGTLAFKDGTNTLFTIVDQGAYGTIRLSDKASTGDPSTCTAGDIYFNDTDNTVKACTSTNTWEQLDTGGSGGITSFSLAGDSGTTQTITDSDTVTISGGTNGIDTSAGSTDTVTLNLDTTEIGTATFGSGSGFTWTFNTGTTDPQITFGDNALTIASAATITLSTFTSNGGPLYTNGTGVLAQVTAGTSTQCLLGGATPFFGSCEGTGTDAFWQQSSGGLLFPNNLTVDLALGGTSTASAKLAFINVNSGTPTASISANSGNNATLLTGLGNLATVNMQTLTLGGVTTGNIVIDSGSSSITLSDAVTASSTITVAGTFTANEILDANGIITLGDGGDAVTIDSNALILQTTGAGSDITINAVDQIILTDFTGNNSALYATATTGVLAAATTSTSNLCLVSGATAPSWAACTSGGTDAFWAQSSGALYPNNSTVDLLIGAQATASAKFAFLNNAGGTPTASISANSGDNATFLTGLGVLGTTNRQTLQLGDSTTGNISMPLLNNKGFTITSDLSGGARSTDVLTISQANNATYDSTGNLLQLTNSDTGSDAPVLKIDTSGSNGVNIEITGENSRGISFPSSMAYGILIGSTASFALDFISWTPTAGIYDTEDFIDINGIAGITSGTFIKLRGSISGSISAFTGDYINISPSRSSNTTIEDTGSFLDLSRGNTTTGGTRTVSGDLATFSSNCTQTAGTCTDTSNILELNQQYANASAPVLNILNSGTGPAASMSGNLVFAGARTIQTTAMNTLTLGGSTTGNIVIDSGSSSITLSDATTASSSLTVSGTLIANGLFDANGQVDLGDGGDAFSLDSTALDVSTLGVISSATGLSSSGTITFSAFTSNGGPLYTNGTGVLAQVTAGTSTQCLLGGTTPSFGSCSSGAAAIDVFWNQSSGALFPNNSTVDLLIGAQATASAKFAVLNINTGTPVASVSSGLGGTSAYLTADGTLGTQNRMALTIGNSSTYNTTGNVLINPNGTGNVGIGTTGPVGKLEIQTTSGDANLYLDAQGVNDVPIIYLQKAGANKWHWAGEYPVATKSCFFSYDDVTACVVTMQANGNVGIGTTAPDARLEINHATGDSLRLTYNDADGSATNYTDLSLSSTGALTITGSAATLAASATAEKTFLTLTPGIITLTAPTAVTSLMETAVLTGATIAADAATTVNKATTLSLVAPIDSTNATITDDSALRILNVTSGAGTLTNQYGILVEDMTAGATADFGIAIAGADTAALWISSDADTTDAANGIAFGLSRDTNLYRSAANTLATDDALTVTGTLTANGILDANGVVTLGDGGDAVTIDSNALILQTTGVGSDITINAVDQIIFTDFTGNNSALYATATTGVLAAATTSTQNLCLVSGASAPSWAACTSGGTDAFWAQSSGALYPNNSTVDLTIGGQSTASAKFAVLNMATGTPTASISANSGNIATYLTGLGNLQTTNGQTLTLGGTTTGLINILNKSGNAFATFDTVNSGLSLGANESINGLLTFFSSGVGITDPTISTNSSGTLLLTGPAGNVTFSLAAGERVIVDGSTTANTTTAGALDLNVTSLTHDNRGLDLAYTSTAAGAAATITQYGISNVFTSTAAVTATSPTFNQYATYQTASKSGADNLTTGGTFNLYGVYGTASNTSTDVGAAGTRNTYGGYFDATGAAGGTTTAIGVYLADVSGADTNVALCFDCDGTWTASTVASGIQFGTDANAVTLYRSASDTLRTGDSLTVDLDLTVSGTLTANGILDANGVVTLGDGGDAVTIDSNALILQTTGVGSDITINAVDQIIFTDFTGNNSALYATATTGVLASATTSTQNLCLVSGATAPSWASCSSGAAASDVYWNQTAGALHPNNSTVDFLIGAQATASAKFAVLNINSGTPTASLSAGTAGGAFLTADGYLSTTARQSLTLGNSASYNTTGNILLNPNGTGNVGIGTTSPVAPLEISAASNGLLFLRRQTEAVNNTAGLIFLTGSGTFADTNELGGIRATITQADPSALKSDLTFSVNSGDSEQERMRITSGGNVGIGTTAPTALLDVAGAASVSSSLTFRTGAGSIQTTAMNTLTLGGSTTGNIVIDSGSSSITLSDATTASSSLTVSGTLIANGLLDANGQVDLGDGGDTFSLDSTALDVSTLGVISGATGLSSSGTITFSGFTSNGGPLYTNGSGVLAQVTAGTTTQCLLGGTTPSFGSCSSGAAAIDVFWNQSLGALYPNNSTVDLLIGGQATSSAKFAVLNVNSGITTATVSGNLIVYPNNGAGGRVGIRTTNPTTDLEVSGDVLLTDQAPSQRTLQIGGASAGNEGGELNLLGSSTNSDWFIDNYAGTLRLGITGADRFQFTTDFTLTGSGRSIFFTSGGTVNTTNNGNLTLTANGTGDVLFTTDADTLVGIGNTTPLVELDVTGSASLSANLSLRGAATAHTFNILDNGTLNIQRSPGGDAGLATVMYLSNAGNVGIGNTSPQELLHIGAGGDAAGQVVSDLIVTRAGASALSVRDSANDVEAQVYAGSGGGGEVIFGSITNHYVDLKTNNQTVMRLTTGGNVGIGTTAPDARLEINHATGDSLRLTYNDADGSATNTTDFELASDGSFTLTSTGVDVTFVSDFNTGINIGSSSNTPAPLSVSGGIGSNAAFILNQTNSGDILSASASGVTKFTVANNGNTTIVGSATTCVIGNGTSATNCSASDERLKTNITNISESLGLSAVMALNPVSYNWNEWMKSNNAPSEIQFGFIAREIANVFPNLVTQDVNTGYYKLDYQGLFAPIVKAIQEQQVQIDNLGNINSRNFETVTAVTATISSLLDVGTIRANSLELSSEGWQEAIATGGMKDITSLVLSEAREIFESTASAQFKFDTLNSGIASISGRLTNIEDLLRNVNFVSFATGSGEFASVENLMVSGSTTLSELSVLNTLSVGNDLTIGSNSINTLNAPLEIQPFAQQDVNFLGGKVTFDTLGNIKVEGNAEFAKDVSVGGVLSARDIAVGRADLPQIISDTEIIATGSSGLVTLPAGETELNVNDEVAKISSAIFITPKTELVVPLYIKQQADGSFVVGIKEQQIVDVKFNFLIVN